MSKDMRRETTGRNVATTCLHAYVDLSASHAGPGATTESHGAHRGQRPRAGTAWCPTRSGAAREAAPPAAMCAAAYTAGTPSCRPTASSGSTTPPLSCERSWYWPPVCLTACGRAGTCAHECGHRCTQAGRQGWGTCGRGHRLALTRYQGGTGRAIPKG